MHLTKERIPQRESATPKETLVSSREVSGYRLQREQEAREKRILMLVTIVALAAMLLATIWYVLR